MKNERNWCVVLAIVFLSLSAQAQQLKLFSEGVRSISSRQQLMVMDFMEHYFPTVMKKGAASMQMKMADDKVFFRKGRPQDLYLVNDTMPMAISLVDKHYEVSWAKDDKPFITVVFPAQYDLIMGMGQEEAQNRLKEDICASEMRSQKPSVPEGLVERGGVYVSEKGHFELESLKDATFYRKNGNKFVPVFEDEHKDLSAANLFHGLAEDAAYQLYVEQSVYGMKTINYNIRLSQWLDYCNSMNLKVFFAVEEEREDGLLAIVIAHSRELGFNHMLSVVIPDNFVIHPNAVLKARLTCYIPTHNLKNLYQQETNNRKRKQWQ
ncbi:MAG: hypothetical protein J5529_06825 [Prevotella sp.]|nr:hypothetical protein [Prevotella sp.]